MKIGFALALVGGVVAFMLTFAMIFTAGWDRPPVDATQIGYRGIGMETVVNPRTEAAKVAAQEAPFMDEPFPAEGPRASVVYENVRVLGDLREGQFLRLMGAITEWVSPEQGCNYCHNPENLAADDIDGKPIYTKAAARRMLQMTKHVNASYGNHVGQTGVTCYTCHRGNPVPEYVWFENTGPKGAAGFAASRNGQNIAAARVGMSSLPSDPFSSMLTVENPDVRVVSQTALPDGNTRTIKDTEWTYGLMIHMSEALGRNCTFCHNSRAFTSWEQSPPQRVTAYHGLGMVRSVNDGYVTPLTPQFPAMRKGPEGDIGKVSCATCHQGRNKPLGGLQMLKNYPELDLVSE